MAGMWAPQMAAAKATKTGLRMAALKEPSLAAMWADPRVDCLARKTAEWRVESTVASMALQMAGWLVTYLVANWAEH